MAEPKAKVFDITHPGKTAPSSTSRPVIVTNHSLMKDPMMANDSSSEPADHEPAAPAPSTPSSRLVIKPLTDSEPATIGTKAAPDEPTDATDDEDAPASTVSEPTAEEKTPAADTTEEMPPAAADDDPSAEESAKPSADPPAGATASTKKAAKPQTPEELAAAAQEAERQAAEHTAAIQQLADSHKYYLPIVSQEKRQARRFVALGVLLVLLLAVAWLDVALDAGLVTMGGKLPHTHFFAVAAAPASEVLSPASEHSYTTALSKLQFSYPSSWKLTKRVANSSQEDVYMQPVTASGMPPVSVDCASTNSPNTAMQMVSNVQYSVSTQLTHPIAGRTMYLNETVIEQAPTSYYINSQLTTSASISTGMTVLPRSFSAAPGFYTSFGLTATAGNGKDFSSLAAAEQYLQATAYKQGRSILLSAKSV